MKKEKRLYRVDIDISYLVFTDEEYTQGDVLNWIKNSIHHGELDDACQITAVKDVDEIEDDFDMCYYPYCGNGEADVQELSLEDIIDELGLDAKKMIKRLEALGYEVTKK